MRGGIFESLPGESDKYEAAGDVTPEATLLPVCLDLNSAEISAEDLSAESVDIPLLLYSHQGKGIHELHLYGGQRLLVQRFADGWLQVQTPHGHQGSVAGNFFQVWTDVVEQRAPLLHDFTVVSQTEQEHTSTPRTCTLTPSPSFTAPTPQSNLSTPRTVTCSPEKIRLFTDNSSLKRSVNFHTDQRDTNIREEETIKQATMTMAQNLSRHSPASILRELMSHTLTDGTENGKECTAATLIQARARGMIARQDSAHQARSYRTKVGAMLTCAKIDGVDAMTEMQQQTGELPTQTQDHALSSAGGKHEDDAHTLALATITEERLKEEEEEIAMQVEGMEDSKLWNNVERDGKVGQEGEVEEVCKESLTMNVEDDIDGGGCRSLRLHPPLSSSQYRGHGADFVFNVDLTQIEDEGKFKQQMQHDVATSLGLCPSSTKVQHVSLTGVMVALRVECSQRDQGEVFHLLLDQMYNPTSVLMNGVLTRHTTGIFVVGGRGNASPQDLRHAKKRPEEEGFDETQRGSDKDENADPVSENSSHTVEVRFDHLEHVRAERQRGERRIRALETGILDSLVRSTSKAPSHRSAHTQTDVPHLMEAPDVSSVPSISDTRLLSPLIHEQRLLAPLTRHEHFVNTQRRIIGEIHAENASLRDSRASLLEAQHSVMSWSAGLQRSVNELTDQNEVLRTQGEKYRQELDITRQKLALREALEEQQHQHHLQELLQSHAEQVQKQQMQATLEQQCLQQNLEYLQQVNLEHEQKQKQEHHELAEARRKAAIFQRVAVFMCTSVTSLNADLKTEIREQMAHMNEYTNKKADPFALSAALATSEQNTIIFHDALKQQIMDLQQQMSALQAVLMEGRENLEIMKLQMGRNREIMMLEHAVTVSKLQKEVRRLECDLQRLVVDKEDQKHELRQVLVQLDHQYECCEEHKCRLERERQERAMERHTWELRLSESHPDSVSARNSCESLAGENFDLKSEILNLQGQMQCNPARQTVMEAAPVVMPDVQREAQQNSNLSSKLERDCRSQLVCASSNFAIPVSRTMLCDRPRFVECDLLRDFIAIRRSSALRCCLLLWADCAVTQRNQRAFSCMHILKMASHISLGQKRLSLDTLRTWHAPLNSYSRRRPKMSTSHLLTMPTRVDGEVKCKFSSGNRACSTGLASSQPCSPSPVHNPLHTWSLSKCTETVTLDSVGTNSCSDETCEDQPRGKAGVDKDHSKQSDRGIGVLEDFASSAESSHSFNMKREVVQVWKFATDGTRQQFMNKVVVKEDATPESSTLQGMEDVASTPAVAAESITQYTESSVDERLVEHTERGDQDEPSHDPQACCYQNLIDELPEGSKASSACQSASNEERSTCEQVASGEDGGEPMVSSVDLSTDGYGARLSHVVQASRPLQEYRVPEDEGQKKNITHDTSEVGRHEGEELEEVEAEAEDEDEDKDKDYSESGLFESLVSLAESVGKMTGEVVSQGHTNMHLQSDGRASSTRTAREPRGFTFSHARRGGGGGFGGGGGGGGGGNPSATHSANRHHIRRLLDMI